MSNYLNSSFISTLVLVSLSPYALSAETQFDKIILTEEFHAEAAAVGDIDKDGHPDAIYGSSWYAGPDFRKSFPIYPVENFDPHKYSNNFATFVTDVDSDGHPDVLVNVWPGKEVAWFRNPGSGQRQKHTWDRHLVFPEVDNESPTLADITDDGQPKLCFHTGGVLGFVTPGGKSGLERWNFTPCSEKEDWHRYTHGLGVGDINGDGRADFLMADGWWEHPVQAGNRLWKKHAFPFGSGGAQMYATDIDGDGDADVVTSLAAHQYGLAWFEQTKNADNEITFRRHLVLPDSPEGTLEGVQFSQPHAVVVADVNGDGLADIITGKRYWAHGPNKDPDAGGKPVFYWFELMRETDGDGHVAVSFRPHLIDSESGVGTQFSAADLNGDGRIDFVVGNKRGGFVFLQKSTE